MKLSDADMPRTEPVLPPHITPGQIEDMARDYWSRISERSWATVDFPTRKAVIKECMNHLALTWAAKEAGIG